MYLYLIWFFVIIYIYVYVIIACLSRCINCTVHSLLQLLHAYATKPLVADLQYKQNKGNVHKHVCKLHMLHFSALRIQELYR